MRTERRLSRCFEFNLFWQVSVRVVLDRFSLSQEALDVYNVTFVSCSFDRGLTRPTINLGTWQSDPTLQSKPVQPHPTSLPKLVLPRYGFRRCPKAALRSPALGA